MTDIKQFDVYIIRFHFTSGAGFKQRPAVVISSNDYNLERSDVIMMPITGVEPFNDLLTLPINDWKITGLTKQSYVKPIFATFEKQQLIRKIGEMNETDKKAIFKLVHIITTM
jgi:mRNA interferase MazF